MSSQDQCICVECFRNFPTKKQKPRSKKNLAEHYNVKHPNSKLKRGGRYYSLNKNGKPMIPNTLTFLTNK